MGRKKRKYNAYIFDDYEEERRPSYQPYGDYYSGERNYGGYQSYAYDYSNFNRFQWSGFNSMYSNDLDEKKLYYNKPEGYATPNKDEIEKKLRRLGHIGTETNATLVGNMTRYFYYRLMDEPDCLKDEFDIPDLEEKNPYVFGFDKMLKEYWNVPPFGRTPLEQAISLFDILSKQKKSKEGFAVKMDARGDGIAIRSDILQDATYNDLLDRMETNQDKKVGILEKLSLIQDFGTEFKVEKETIEKLSPSSKITQQRLMHDYSQLHMVEVYQRLLPHYDIKLLTKDLVVKAHIERAEHKQKIIMIVDYSGSMQNKDKQEWVLALVMDRMKYVIKGEAEIFFSFFTYVTSTLHFTHIHNAATAFDFWKRFQTAPDGSGTDVGRIVEYIGEEVRSGKLHNLDIDLKDSKPELLVINDGQDRIKTEAFTYKTNAVTLLQDNEELKELCLKNFGKYVHINTKNQVIYN